MSEPVITEVKDKDVMKIVDNVLINKMSSVDMTSAVKKADIEYDIDNPPKGKLLDSSDNVTKVVPEVDPIRDTLSSLLNVYTNKLGHQITYDSVQDSIRVAIMSSRSARELTKAIQGDLAATMSEVLIFKSIIVIGKVIDTQLNGIMSTDFTDGLNGETVSVLNQMFGWIEKLEAIKAKYTQFDIDQKIRDLTNVKSDVNRRTELELHLIDVLKRGVDEFNRKSENV